VFQHSENQRSTLYPPDYLSSGRKGYFHMLKRGEPGVEVFSSYTICDKNGMASFSVF
jgi:hypothetical protein